MSARRGGGALRWRESDEAWGRAAGVRPPLSVRAVLLTWAAAAAVLAAVVVVLIGGPGALDDPDRGEQRAGLLLDPAEAPVVRGVTLPGRPLGRRPVLVLFDRRGYDAARVGRVAAAVPDDFAVVVVVPRAPRTGRGRRDVRVLTDPGNALASRFALNAPVIGGFPTGYVVVDAQRRVRYATLDPSYAEHAFEVRIVTDPLT